MTLKSAPKFPLDVNYKFITVKIYFDKTKGKKKPYRVRVAGFEDEMFATQEEAESFAEARAIQIYNSIPILTPTQIDELKIKAHKFDAAAGKLAEFGWGFSQGFDTLLGLLTEMGPVNLREFAHIYGPRMAKIKETMVPDAVAAFRKYLQTVEATKKHRGNQETHLREFEEKFKDRFIHHVFCNDIDLWLLERVGVTNSHDKWRYSLSKLFTYSRDYLNALPRNCPTEVELLQRRKRDKAPSEVFTIKEIVRLGRVLPDRKTLLAFSLALFGFVRNSEIRNKLTVEKFLRNKADRIYMLNLLGKHKPGQLLHRQIDPLPQNLCQILEILLPKSGRLFTDDVFERIRLIAKAHNIRWPHNVLRHCCSSYALANGEKDKDIAKWAGDTVDNLYKHYIVDVEAPEAKKYWKITFNRARMVKLPWEKKLSCESKKKFSQKKSVEMGQMEFLEGNLQKAA